MTFETQVPEAKCWPLTESEPEKKPTKRQMDHFMFYCVIIIRLKAFPYKSADAARFEPRCAKDHIQSLFSLLLDILPGMAKCCATPLLDYKLRCIC